MSVYAILFASEGTSCLPFPTRLSPLQSQPCHYWKSGKHTRAGVSKSVHCNAVFLNLWSRAELRNRHIRFEVWVGVGCPHNWGDLGSSTLSHWPYGLGCDSPCLRLLAMQDHLCEKVSKYLSLLSESGLDQGVGFLWSQAILRGLWPQPDF